MSTDLSPTSFTSQIIPDDGGRVLMETFKTGRVLELTVDDDSDPDAPTATVTLTPEEARTLGRFLIKQANDLRAGRK